MDARLLLATLQTVAMRLMASRAIEALSWKWKPPEPPLRRTQSVSHRDRERTDVPLSFPHNSANGAPGGPEPATDLSQNDPQITTDLSLPHDRIYRQEVRNKKKETHPLPPPTGGGAGKTPPDKARNRRAASGTLGELHRATQERNVRHPDRRGGCEALEADQARRARLDLVSRRGGWRLSAR